MMSGSTKKEDRKFILEVIQVYRNLPALWKIKSDEYSDRNKLESYEILHIKYQERFPEVTIDDVEKKIYCD